MTTPARLSSPREFKRVIEHGMRTSTPILSVAIAPAEGGGRVGVSANKRIGSSVYRNRAKRLLREAARTCPASGYDVVLVARAGIAGKNCQQVQEQMAAALRRLGVAC